MQMQPTAIFTPFGGRAEVWLFGKQTGNWSTTDIQEHGIRGRVYANLARIAAQANIKNISAPSTTQCNALLVTPEELQRCYRSPDSPLTLWRGKDADGVEVPIGEGVFYSTGDCPTIIATGANGKIIAAHAGRRSLIYEREELRQTRQSITWQIASVLEFSDLKVFTCGGIGSSHYVFPFTHPYTEKVHLAVHESLDNNQNIISEVWRPDPMRKQYRLSLHELVRAQFKNLKDDTVCGSDCVDTYSDQNEKGLLWWSHRRWEVDELKAGPDGRNGVLVIRRW